MPKTNSVRKGEQNAGLTLGIIGTALAALGNNGGGCGKQRWYF